MSDLNPAGWPGRVAVAIVRSDPPQVFLASDQDVLGRVLALQVVAQSRTADLAVEHVRDIRKALLAEEWAEAVSTWIAATGEVVDAYPDEDIWTSDRIDAEVANLEIRMSPIFVGELPPDPRDDPEDE